MHGLLRKAIFFVFYLLRLKKRERKLIGSNFVNMKKQVNPWQFAPSPMGFYVQVDPVIDGE